MFFNSNFYHLFFILLPLICRIFWITVLKIFKILSHRAYYFPLGEVLSVLKEKSKTVEETIENVNGAFDVAAFIVGFLTTFRDWNISRLDEKSNRSNKR